METRFEDIQKMIEEYNQAQSAHRQTDGQDAAAGSASSEGTRTASSATATSAASGTANEKPRKRRRYRTEAKYRMRRLGLLLAFLLLLCGVGLGVNSLLHGGGLENILPASGSGRGDATKIGAGMTVVLDAGHGGDDPGCTWEEINESDINLSITKKLQAILERNGFTVVMTRETSEENPTLKERVAITNDSDGDLFISIHQNALEGDTTISGIETFCTEDNLKLGEQIQQNMIAATGAEDRGVTTNVYLYVVNKAEMPACLLETGYLTVAKERALLISDAYQDKLAASIAEGIIAYVTGNSAASA